MFKKTFIKIFQETEKKPGKVKVVKKEGFGYRTAILSFILLTTISPISRAEVKVVVDMGKIRSIESSNNPLAYNKTSGARGLYQITPICLKEYNIFHKVKYSLQDLYNPLINEKVARWYLCKRIPQLLAYYKKPITIENILWSYNAGIGKVVKNDLPDETRDYILKYRR